MSDPLGELERARESLRQAREEVRRLRGESRDARRESRTQARQERRGHKAGDQHGPHGWPEGFAWAGALVGDEDDRPEGFRAEQHFSLEGVRKVRIDQTAGRLTVRPCAEGESPGAVSSGQKSAPQLTVERQGEDLIIGVRLQKGWLFRRRQGANTVVRLQAGLESLRVDLGFGDARLRDLAAGRLRVDVGAGEIGAYSLRGDLKADVGAGKIAVHDHVGLVACNTGTGDVMVDVAELAAGEYQLDVGMGRAELRLPQGGQVAVEISSGIGRARNEYPSGPPDAPTQAKVSTGIGEATVRVRAEGKPPGRPPAAPRATRRGPGSAMRWREAEQLRVLQMLEQGKVTSQEAADLIAALQGASPPPAEDGEATS